MRKEELDTLLKVVRGISSLPNLTFVCAVERDTLLYTVSGKASRESNIYFEKFFPVSVPVPRLDEKELRHAGTERLAKVFRSRQWFVSAEEEQTFRKHLGEVWDKRIAPCCGTLRAIGLLANDVSVAAAPLYREVDSVDLVLIEVLRRFHPTVYDLVARNGLVLTGGESIFREGSFHTDEEKKRLLAQLRQELTIAFADSDPDLNLVRGIIGELFPDYAKAENLAWAERPKRKGALGGDKRISVPSIFPAYFRYEIPKAVFSTVELDKFIRESKEADHESRKRLLADKLRTMPKGSLKKDDFFSKLAESVKTVDLELAKAWVAGSLALANDLTYDLFAAFGEAGHVTRMIIRTGARISLPPRIEFLSDCILNSSDDSIPVRVLTSLTDPNSDAYQSVSFAQLYPAFIKRMRSRYGRDIDAQTVDLRTSDRNSFSLWGFTDLSRHGLAFDPEDHAIQRDFWRRYVGQSKSRLVQVFNDYLMPPMIYQSDPEAFVEQKIDVETLRTLFSGLPDDPGLALLPKRSVTRMRKFLDGEYKGGVGIDEPEGEEDEVN